MIKARIHPEMLPRTLPKITRYDREHRTTTDSMATQHTPDALPTPPTTRKYNTRHANKTEQLQVQVDGSHVLVTVNVALAMIQTID